MKQLSQESRTPRLSRRTLFGAFGGGLALELLNACSSDDEPRQSRPKPTPTVASASPSPAETTSPTPTPESIAAARLQTTATAAMKDLINALKNGNGGVEASQVDHRLAYLNNKPVAVKDGPLPYISLAYDSDKSSLLLQLSSMKQRDNSESEVPNESVELHFVLPHDAVNKVDEKIAAHMRVNPLDFEHLLANATLREAYVNNEEGTLSQRITFEGNSSLQYAESHQDAHFAPQHPATAQEIESISRSLQLTELSLRSMFLPPIAV